MYLDFPTTDALPTTDAPIESETPYYPSIASTPAWGGYLSLGDDEPPSVTIAPNSGYLSVGDDIKSTIPPGAPNSGYLSAGDGSTPTAPPNAPGNMNTYPTISATPASGYLKVGDTTTNNPADPTPDGGSPTDQPSSGYLSVNGGSEPTPFIVVENGVTLTQTPDGAPKSGYLSSPNSGYLKATGSSAPKPSATVVNSTGTYYVYKDGQSIIAPQITLEQVRQSPLSNVVSRDF
jgi:hypothetical protein